MSQQNIVTSVDQSENMSHQNVTVTTGPSSLATIVLSMPPDGFKKGPWTSAEDAILIDYVKKHGEGNWNIVQKNSGLMRCPKSCRLRWTNHLRPNLKKGNISREEEHIILTLHAMYGNKWSTIAAKLPGRSDNEIKNYWNARFKKIKRLGLPVYPPEVEIHFDPFHHRHNHQLNNYRSQLQNKNNNQEKPNPQLVEQTISDPFQPPFESLQSIAPPPPLPQQPIHFGQNSSYIGSTSTLFDIVSVPHPTQNHNPSNLTDSIPSQYFRVLNNNYGGLGLNVCTDPPTLDHQGLVTPNFLPYQFGSFNLTSSPNQFDLGTFQNSIVVAAAQSELHSVQSFHGLNNNVEVEFMAGPSAVTNNNFEMAPELMFEDNNTWSDVMVNGVTEAGDFLVDGVAGVGDFLVDGFAGAGDFLVDGVTGNRDFLVSGVTKAGDFLVPGVTESRDFMVDGISGIENMGSGVHSVVAANSLNADKNVLEATNIDEDIMNLLDFHNDQPVLDYCCNYLFTNKL